MFTLSLPFYRLSWSEFNLPLVESSPHTGFRFGQPILMRDYLEQFVSEDEGAPRAAVKRLTATIERELTQSTINAPDWSVVRRPDALPALTRA